MEDSNHISILLHHDGRWDSTGNYVDYKIEGVIFNASTKYEGLLTTIATQLGVDTSIYELVLEFVVSAQSPPMRIHNDMGIYVYLDKKNIIRISSQGIHCV